MQIKLIHWPTLTLLCEFLIRQNIILHSLCRILVENTLQIESFTNWELYKWHHWRRLYKLLISWRRASNSFWRRSATEEELSLIHDLTSSTISCFFNRKCCLITSSKPKEHSQHTVSTRYSEHVFSVHKYRGDNESVFSECSAYIYRGVKDTRSRLPELMEHGPLQSANANVVVVVVTGFLTCWRVHLWFIAYYSLHTSLHVITQYM